ncbi:MAG: cytochrome b/b6 domain-containing protein [Methylotenera sp.]|nr:cytochrome b/b6 domain-containing protein [Methylotenera sp.]
MNHDDQSVSWTALIRITHWLVALCVLVNFFNDTGFWHRVIGYTCLALVCLRVVNGLFISKVSSSKLYVPRVSNLKAHFKELLHKRGPAYAGHNPFGQWAVYLMWLLIALLALSGWVSRTDALWGEDWPVDLHKALSDVLQGIVILHLLAIALMSKLQKQNLVKAMIVSKE